MIMVFGQIAESLDCRNTILLSGLRALQQKREIGRRGNPAYQVKPENSSAYVNLYEAKHVSVREI